MSADERTQITNSKVNLAKADNELNQINKFLDVAGRQVKVATDIKNKCDSLLQKDLPAVKSNDEKFKNIKTAANLGNVVVLSAHALGLCDVDNNPLQATSDVFNTAVGRFNAAVNTFVGLREPDDADIRTIRSAITAFQVVIDPTRNAYIAAPRVAGAENLKSAVDAANSSVDEVIAGVDALESRDAKIYEINTSFIALNAVIEASGNFLGKSIFAELGDERANSINIDNVPYATNYLSDISVGGCYNQRGFTFFQLDDLHGYIGKVKVLNENVTNSLKNIDMVVDSEAFKNAKDSAVNEVNHYASVETSIAEDIDVEGAMAVRQQAIDKASIKAQLAMQSYANIRVAIERALQASRG